MSISRLNVKSYQEPIGRSMTPEQMMTALIPGLTKLIGPFCHQSSQFRTYPNQHLKTEVMAGKPFKGQALYRFLDDLDFTPTQTAITGSYGGFRHELDGRKTNVLYCNYSGVITISSSIVVIVDKE